MKKIIITLFVIILVSSFIWLGIKQPQIEPKTIEQSIDTTQFLNDQ